MRIEDRLAVSLEQIFAEGGVRFSGVGCTKGVDRRGAGATGPKAVMASPCKRYAYLAVNDGFDGAIMLLPLFAEPGGNAREYRLGFRGKKAVHRNDKGNKGATPGEANF